MQYDKTPFGSLEQRRSALDSQKENSGRLAWSYAWWNTTGRGEILVDTVFEFNVGFIQEPSFLSGAAIDTDTGPDLITGHFPRVHAGCYQWKRDGKGLYTGAWVYFVVDTFGPGGTATVDEPQYVIHHHLAWQGIALKSVPGVLIQASTGALINSSAVTGTSD